MVHASLVSYIGVFFMSLGAAIRALSFHHLGRFFTFELAVKPGHKLVTDGPYRIVRHPAYTGSCCFYVGICMSLLGRGSWLAASGLWETGAGRTFGGVFIGYSVFVCWTLISRVPKEDTVMRDEFGREWEVWAKRTPYRLVPCVY